MVTRDSYKATHGLPVGAKAQAALDSKLYTWNKGIGISPYSAVKLLRHGLMKPYHHIHKLFLNPPECWKKQMEQLRLNHNQTHFRTLTHL